MAGYLDEVAFAHYSAKYHLQVELSQRYRAKDAESDKGGTGTLNVRCTIKRIFRGEQELELEDEIALTVGICDHPHGVEGGLILAGIFDKCRYMEVFLNGSPPDFENARWGLNMISELTSEPTVSVDIDRAIVVETEREAMRQNSEEAKKLIERDRKESASKNTELQGWDKDHKWVGQPNPATTQDQPRPKRWWQFWR